MSAWNQGVLAIAIGLALGLLWGKAQAANGGTKSCFRGAYDMREWTCLMETAPEPMARQWAKETLRECERSALMHASRDWHARDAADCAKVRDYIGRRWGKP